MQWIETVNQYFSSWDELYECYCEFAEASRTELLRVSIVPENRQSIASKPAAMPQEEFHTALAAMNNTDLAEYLADLKAGYNATHAKHANRLQAKFKDYLNLGG